MLLSTVKLLYAIPRRRFFLTLLSSTSRYYLIRLKSVSTLTIVLKELSLRSCYWLLFHQGICLQVGFHRCRIQFFRICRYHLMIFHTNSIFPDDASAADIRLILPLLTLLKICKLVFGDMLICDNVSIVLICFIFLMFHYA